MKFKDICKIDRRPFDEVVLEKFYRNGCVFTDDVATIIRLYLFHWYFIKFNEIYGTNITLLDDSKLIVGNLRDNAFPIQDLGDTMAEYEYDCHKILASMALYAGFDVLSIPIDEELFPMEAWELPHLQQKRYFKNEFKNLPPSWHSIMWKNLKNIRDSMYYFEDGTILIFRNKKIRAYELLCKKHPDIMNNRFRDEKKIMDEVIEEIMSPLFLKYTHEIGEVGEYKYIYIDMGSDGYNYLGLSELNFHWIINCFVFKHLFDDLKIKLQQLAEIYPELRYVA